MTNAPDSRAIQRLSNASSWDKNRSSAVEPLPAPLNREPRMNARHKMESEPEANASEPINKVDTRNFCHHHHVGAVAVSSAALCANDPIIRRAEHGNCFTPAETGIAASRSNAGAKLTIK